MTEVSRNLRHIFLAKIPPILKLEVGFFSDRKKFFADFRKYCKFFPPGLYFNKNQKNRRMFLDHSSSSFRPPASGWLLGEGRRSQVYTAQVHTASANNVQDQLGAVRFTRVICTRLQHRTCKTSWEHFASLVASKKVPATWWDFDFFFQKISDFENSSWIFFHFKNFQKFYDEIQ